LGLKFWKDSQKAGNVENEGILLLREVMRMLMEAVKIFRRARLLYVRTDLQRRKAGLERRDFMRPTLERKIYLYETV